jgi:hypothetical protein
MSTGEEQSDLEQERGYGAAEDDVNEDSPLQEQQRHPEEESREADATGDAFTEKARRETESGPGEAG